MQYSTFNVEDHPCIYHMHGRCAAVYNFIMHFGGALHGQPLFIAAIMSVLLIGTNSCLATYHILCTIINYARCSVHTIHQQNSVETNMHP